MLIDIDTYSPTVNLSRYIEIKKLEERMLSFIASHAINEYTHEQADMIGHLNTAAIHFIISSKHLKDVAHHIDNIRGNTDDTIMSESTYFFKKVIESIANFVQSVEENPEIIEEDFRLSIKEYIAKIHSDSDIFIGGISTKLNQQSRNDINIAEIIKTNYYIILSSETLLKWYEAFITGTIHYHSSIK